MKRLSFRFVRRAFLILALLFPIVYLTGSFFFALNGSHGNQLFAEPVYTEEYVQVDSVVDDGATYRVEVSDSTSLLAYLATHPNKRFTGYFKLNGVEHYDGGAGYSLLIGYYNNESYSRMYVYPQTTLVMDGNGNLSSSMAYPLVFDSSSFSFITSVHNIFSSFSTLYKLISVPTEYVPENNSAYTDFIFTKPFSNNNFITELGKGVVDQTAPGFEPFRDMLYWFNDNMLGVAVDDGLGCFGIGYCYYALNVVAIYELVVLVVMIFTLPLKLTDRFTKEM